jgi:hypothetical protein
MDKKPGLLVTISIFTIIVVAVSFHLNLGSNAPIELAEGVNPDNALYVCPAVTDTWTRIAQGLHFLAQFAPLFFSFAGIVLIFSWGWALYQNLLKDKFVDEAYKNPWGLTKAFFWLVVIFTILYVTPNHFRQVEVRGSEEQWVLCENTSDGARAVNYRAVRLH